MDELISQEELEEVCPFMVDELERCISESDTFKDAEEATIYAITQLLHDRLEKLDMTPENKGAVVSTLISGLCEFNADALAAHRELLRTLLDKKASTIH